MAKNLLYFKISNFKKLKKRAIWTGQTGGGHMATPVKVGCDLKSVNEGLIAMCML